jgi:hypothetical protein
MLMESSGRQVVEAEDQPPSVCEEINNGGRRNEAENQQQANKPAGRKDEV